MTTCDLFQGDSALSEAAFERNSKTYSKPDGRSRKMWVSHCFTNIIRYIPLYTLGVACQLSVVKRRPLPTWEYFVSAFNSMSRLSPHGFSSRNWPPWSWSISLPEQQTPSAPLGGYEGASWLVSFNLSGKKHFSPWDCYLFVGWTMSMPGLRHLFFWLVSVISAGDKFSFFRVLSSLEQPFWGVTLFPLVFDFGSCLDGEVCVCVFLNALVTSLTDFESRISIFRQHSFFVHEFDELVCVCVRA